MDAIHIGCSGWNYAHWRDGVFYPPKLPPREWLSYYAQRFDTVEVNATFYRLPAITTVARWAEATPDGFQFAVKTSRYLTHVKRLSGLPGHVEKLVERIEPLIASSKLGPLLWQLPPNLARDDERLAEALESFPAGLRHAIEFRHRSWFAQDIFGQLAQRGVAVVIADRAGSPELVRQELTSDFAYVRFHAGTAGNGDYSHAELGAWKRRLADLAGGVEVFAYFNNDQEGHAVENARYLHASLAAAR
jgi:uncharacterized protein YecE (DUF72 family)